MSLFISANKLFFLTQSHRLCNIFSGNFVVQVLHPPNTIPYCCSSSLETVEEVLDAELVEATTLPGLPAHWEMELESFMQLLTEPGASDASDVVSHTKLTVHAELTMLMAMDEGKIKGVFPYIGASKLSCIMCRNYISAFNEIMERKFTKQKITVKGSNGKSYPG